MKRTALLIICAAAVLTLAACGKTEEVRCDNFMANNEAEWTFKKARRDIAQPPYGGEIFLAGGEGEFASYDLCALVLGKIYSLFGEPTSGSDFDDFYYYEIIAEAPGRDTAKLIIHEHNSAPSVTYNEGFEDAAQALVETINAAKPADYEYSGKEMESFHMITYFAADGKAGSRDRTLTIKEIFDGNPSPEDIEQFTEWGYELG